MNNASYELSISELDAVNGGNRCEHGMGKCGAEDSPLRGLRQLESSLIDAGKAVASSLLSIIT
jgi:hypothetical protein